MERANERVTRPREQAFTAAERLASTGLAGDRLLTALRELGFPDAEAHVAVNALRAKQLDDDRATREAHLREALDKGYLSLLFAAGSIGAGLVLVLLRVAVLPGALAIAGGLGLIVRGLWLHWRGRGV